MFTIQKRFFCVTQRANDLTKRRVKTNNFIEGLKLEEFDRFKFKCDGAMEIKRISSIWLRTKKSCSGVKPTPWSTSAFGWGKKSTIFDSSKTTEILQLASWDGDLRPGVLGQPKFPKLDVMWSFFQSGSLNHYVN